MKKFLGIGLTLLLFLTGTIGLTAQGTAVGNYGITIVKYKLDDPTILESQLPLNGTKAEEVKDNDGNQLAPLPGISYEITRVTPVAGETKFEPVTGNDAFSTTITTDANGIATIDQLPQGTYRVVEVANTLLKETMEPVILELPLPQTTGEALDQVYLYPKSSVREPVPGTGTETGTGTGSKGRLPQTSGNIGSGTSLILILGFIVVMSLVGWKVMKSKKMDF